MHKLLKELCTPVALGCVLYWYCTGLMHIVIKLAVSSIVQLPGMTVKQP